MQEPTHKKTKSNLVQPETQQSHDITGMTNSVNELATLMEFPLMNQPELFDSGSQPQTASSHQNQPAYDPFQGLNHLEMVKVKHDLASSTVLPFNQVDYIQVIANPIDPTQLITVQICNPAIRLRTAELKQEIEQNDKDNFARNFQPRCFNEHDLLPRKLTQMDTKTGAKCSICETDLQLGDVVFSCTSNPLSGSTTQLTAQQCTFQQCQPCSMKQYLRNNLRAQTSQHSLFDPYDLVAADENSKDEDPIAESSIMISDEDRIKDLQERLAIIQSSPLKTVTAQRFANIAKGELSYAGDNWGFKKYVVLGFWRLQNGFYDCYRMFKIDSPAFLKMKLSVNKDSNFLHSGNSQELMFFTKARDSFCCNFIDLKAAQDGTKLTKMTNLLYQIPVLQTFVFQKTTLVGQMLTMLLLSQDLSLRSQQHIQIYNFGQSKVICLGAPLAYARDTKKLVKTAFPNAIFVNLTEAKIDLIVYNADLILDVQTHGDLPEHVVFLRRKTIIQIEYAANVSESDESAIFLGKGGIPTLCSPQVSYSILAPAKKNFTQLQTELNREIDLCRSKNSVLHGFVHNNRQRVSINYTNGGVFTYGLHRAQPTETPFEIKGEIGDLKEVNFTNCTIVNRKISGQGSDELNGNFTVQGTLDSEKVLWFGNQQKNGMTEQIIFDQFSITAEVVQGRGSDDSGPFNLEGTIQDKKIEFKRIYSNHTIYFHGTISDDQSTIIGAWAYQEGKDFDKLTLHRKHMVEFKMTIQYLDQTWISLNGFYTEQTKVFEGSFHCSESLEKELQFDKKHKSRNKFHLRGFECQDRAVLLYSSTDLNDAHFTHIENKLYVSGNLRLKATESTKSGYTAVDLDLIDLDQKDLQTKVDKKSLYSLLPESFQEVVDNSGNLKLPDYQLTRFIFTKVNGMLKFAGQMFYYDMMANSKRLIFFHGQEKGTLTANLVPQWPPVMSDNYTVQYPILAFKPNLPSDNELVICNIVQNVPQKSINLSPFKFVQFVETGLNPDQHLDPDSIGANYNTSVYFLVSLNDCYYLMCYRCFPWPIDRKLIDPLQQHKFQLKDQMYLVSGKIDLNKFKDQIEPQRMMQDKIQVASMLQRVQQDGVQVMIVLQLVDEIVCFNLTKPTFFQRLQQNDEKMMTIPLIRGTKEQVYYGQISETGVAEIVKLTYVEKEKLTKQNVFRCDNASIVAFSITYNGTLNREDGVLLNVLCSDNKLRRLNNTVSQLDDTFVCDKVTDLHSNKAIIKQINSLQKTIWQKVTVSDKSICAIIQDNKGIMLAAVMSPNSELSVKVETLGFEDDRKFNILKNKLREYVKMKQEILSTQRVPWIGKNIFEVKEAKNCYFIVQDQYASRRVDLMRIDTEMSLREDWKLVGNKYVALKLRNTNQYLLNDQSSLFFVRNYPARQLKALTPTTNGIQYFAQEVSKSDSGQLNQVVKFDENGNSKLVYKDVFDDLTAVREAFFHGRPIDLDSEWALHQNKEHILGAFAYSYYEEVEPLKEDQKQLSNGMMAVEVIMINKSINTKLDQIVVKDPKISAANFLFQSLGVASIEKLEAQADALNSIFEQENICPTVFVMRCQNWQKPKSLKDSRSALFTQDYLVLKHGMFICFAKMRDIQKVNEEESRKCNSEQAHTGIGRFKELYEEKRCKIQFKLINAGVLTSRITKSDFAIQEVVAYDLQIADKGEERRNVIQISFADLALLWDLDENKEVTFLNKPQDFAVNEHYTATGFVPYRQFSKKQSLMSQAQFYTSNENKSFLLTASRQSRPSQLIRPYQYINLHDVLYIQKCNKIDQFVAIIDVETMLQNYNDLTFFQIFRSNGQYLDYLIDKIQTERVAEQVCVDEAGEVTDNILIRKIYQTLNLPVIQEGINPSAFTEMSRPSLLQAVMYEVENQQLLTQLLKLVMLSREFRLSNLVGNFGCFEKIFDIQSQQIQKFLEEAYFENTQSKTVMSLMWMPDDTMVTFGSNNSLLNKDQISKQIRNQQLKKISYLQKLRMRIWKDYDPLDGELKTYPVRVRILEVEWVADKLDQLYHYLGGINDNNLFGNEFIKILLENQNYSSQLFMKVFVPYILNMVLNLVYFSYFLPTIPVQGGFFGKKEHRTQAAIRVLICLCSLFFTCVEIRQLFKGKLAYFGDFWNLIFWCTNVLCLVGVIGHGTSTIDLNILIEIGSVVIVLSWLMLYYWMRLFPKLAFYVTMISETLKDIAHFFLMFLMCIAMFANAAYALNFMQPENQNGDTTDDEPQSLWQDAFGVPIIDSFFNQYLIGLGQFYTDPYATSPGSTLVQIYFILATLFTQIMFLNMLIAIMGETFGRVSEAKERSALMERTHLYADFMWGIKLTKELQGMRYLYVVRPNESVSTEDVSQIEAVQKRLTELISENNERNYQEISNLQDKVHTVLQQHYQMQQEMNAKFDQILKLLQK